MNSFRRFLAQPRNGAILLVLLIGIAGIFWWQHARSAPLRQHLEAGAQFLQNKQAEAAEREWQRAVRLDPSSAEAWEQLSNMYFASGNWPAAQDASLQLLKLRPSTPGLLARLATCALKLKDKTKAGVYIETALKQNPDDVEALGVAINLAQVENNRENWLRHLRHLVELQPHNLRSAVDLTIELYQRGDYKEARRIAERMMQQDANFAPSYYLRGLTFFSDNPTPEQLQRAEADFKKALQLNPSEIEARRYLARVYMNLGRPNDAITEFEALGRGRPYASAHWLELSNAYRQAGKVQQAELLRQRFVSLERINRPIMDANSRLSVTPDSFEYLLQMGRLLLQSISSSEDAVQLYAYRFSQGKLLGVESYVRKALQLRPSDSQAKKLLSQIEQTHKRYLQQGQQSLARKDYSQAERQLRRAVLLRPDDAHTANTLQVVLAKIGTARLSTP